MRTIDSALRKTIRGKISELNDIERAIADGIFLDPNMLIAEIKYLLCGTPYRLASRDYIFEGKQYSEYYMERRY